MYICNSIKIILNKKQMVKKFYPCSLGFAILTGQLVYSGFVNGNTFIDFTDNPKGLYFVKTMEGLKIKTFKIIKE